MLANLLGVLVCSVLVGLGIVALCCLCMFCFRVAERVFPNCDVLAGLLGMFLLFAIAFFLLGVVAVFVA